jgi:hypothetical protein
MKFHNLLSPTDERVPLTRIPHVEVIRVSDQFLLIYIYEFMIFILINDDRKFINLYELIIKSLITKLSFKLCLSLLSDIHDFTLIHFYI